MPIFTGQKHTQQWTPKHLLIKTSLTIQTSKNLSTWDSMWKRHRVQQPEKHSRKRTTRKLRTWGQLRRAHLDQHFLFLLWLILKPGPEPLIPGRTIPENSLLIVGCSRNVYLASPAIGKLLVLCSLKVSERLQRKCWTFYITPWGSKWANSQVHWYHCVTEEVNTALT